jgi:signal transduction histidine kinase
MASPVSFWAREPLWRRRPPRAEAEATPQSLAFLLRATSELLEQPMDIETLLTTVTRLVLPALSDRWCIIDVLDGEERLRRVARWPATPATGEETPPGVGLDGAGGAFGCGAGSLVSRVLRTGEPFVFSPDGDGDGDGAAGGDAEVIDVQAAQLAVRSGWRACLIVPLTARGRTLGAVSLIAQARSYGPADVALAQELCDRVAIAIDHARRYQEACAAVAVREDVLAIVSHDLRNPLSAILTSTGRLLEHLDKASGPEGVRVRLPVERCQRAARRMTRMIGDLVDAASLDTGTLSLHRDEHELSRILCDALDLLHPLADARSLDLVSELECSGLRALCDRERVVQVITNLVDNAIKFSPPGGQIRVLVEPYGGAVRFCVSDDGPGIAPDKLEHVFRRYWHDSTRSSRRGAGLGLYIAKGIVEAHGGRIWVESTLGKGSSFYFSLLGAPSAALAATT